MSESWKPVVGFEGRYEVSDEGRVASLRFRGHSDRRIMKSTSNYAGYHVVTLGAERKQFRVHCLVLEAFVSPRPAPEIDGCHGDSDKDNNVVLNLRWDTKVGNIADRRSYAGERHPGAKLTDNQVREVQALRASGLFAKDIAPRFGITLTRVYQLCR